jgi:hypothetical protein
MASIKRYAIAIASSIESANRIVSDLIASKLQLENIAVLGEQRNFAPGSGDRASRIGGLPPTFSEDDGTTAEPTRILSAGRIASEVLPGWAKRNAMALRHSLDRWLTPAHSRRLSSAVSEGAFLVWVELRTVADEQIATRCLLRSSHASVAVHDFFLP